VRGLGAQGDTVCVLVGGLVSELVCGLGLSPTGSGPEAIVEHDVTAVVTQQASATWNILTE
jgi:hypothetical protein